MLSDAEPKIGCLKNVEVLSLSLHSHPGTFDKIFAKFVKHCPKLRRLSVRAVSAYDIEMGDLEAVTASLVGKHLVNRTVLAAECTMLGWESWVWTI
jgi:hypothetical protein